MPDAKPPGRRERPRNPCFVFARAAALTLGIGDPGQPRRIQQPVRQLGRPEQVAPELLPAIHVPGAHGNVDPLEVCEFRLALRHGSQDPGRH